MLGPKMAVSMGLLHKQRRGDRRSEKRVEVKVGVELMQVSAEAKMQEKDEWLLATKSKSHW